jgi:hypothetical protein
MEDQPDAFHLKLFSNGRLRCLRSLLPSGEEKGKSRTLHDRRRSSLRFARCATGQDGCPSASAWPAHTRVPKVKTHPEN